MVDSDSRKFWFYASFFVLLAVIICNELHETAIPVNNDTDSDSDSHSHSSEWLLPLETGNRRNWSSIILESDAHYKALRRTRRFRGVRFHTGIDLQNGGRYGTLGGPGEKVYAVAAGKVIKISGSIPNKRLVISHQLPDGSIVWSSYLHVTDPCVREGEEVTPYTVIARRLNYTELRRYGRSYNHLHFEIFKKLPVPQNNHYTWMSEFCRTAGQVDNYFFNPISFLNARWAEQASGE